MKRQTGSGNEQLEVTGSGGGGGTVDQGTGGSSPWLVEIDPGQLPLPVTASIDPTGLATSAKQDTGNASLASIDTKLTAPIAISNASITQIDANTDPFLVSNAGGYVRQDSTATIAKESGGNLATLAEPVDTKADLTRVGQAAISLATSNTTPVATATTTDVVSAPSSGNHLEIVRLHCSNGSATPCKVSWKEASGSEIFQANLPQYGIMSIDLKQGWHLTTATKLQMVTSAAGSIDWTVAYRTVLD